MPNGKISSSSLGGGRLRWAAELDRRYAGTKMRGEVGMSMAAAVDEACCVVSILGCSSSGESCSMCVTRCRSRSVFISSATLFELKRDRMAGVCGVCGEIGFPGDEAVEIDVPATIGGTPDSCLLEDVDERCRCIDDDIESERAAFESRMRWKRARAADVAVGFRGLASAEAELDWFIKSFCKSSIFKNSDIFSSSACIDSALVPVASASRPEPGWTFDDVALAFPLELSSSALFVPPEDGRPRR